MSCENNMFSLKRRAFQALIATPVIFLAGGCISAPESVEASRVIPGCVTKVRFFPETPLPKGPGIDLIKAPAELKITLLTKPEQKIIDYYKYGKDAEQSIRGDKISVGDKVEIIMARREIVYNPEERAKYNASLSQTITRTPDIMLETVAPTDGGLSTHLSLEEKAGCRV